jgi:hypothetical protein
MDFTPHPGGRVDSVSAAAAAEMPPTTTQPEDAPAVGFTVPVRVQTPEECVPRTQILSTTNPFLQILPRDMRRCKAVIVPVTNAIYLCESADLAGQIATNVIAGTTTIQGMGAYLPANVGIPIEHRDAMYAAIASTASTSPVSVIVQRYAD